MPTPCGPALPLLVSVLLCLNARCMCHADESDRSVSSPLSQCSLYLAPSSIEGAGLGTFTAKDIGAGQQVGPAEIVHNVFDLPLHQSPAIADECNLSDYDWIGEDYQAQTEARRVLSLIPGCGAAINSHPGLHNTIGGMPSVLTSSATVAHESSVIPGVAMYHKLDRSIDPGAGAISYYGDLHSYATSNIKAGSELFSHYSDMYFADRPEVFGLIPLATDFVSADKIIATFIGFVDDNDKAEKNEKLSDDAVEDLWKAIVTSFETKGVSSVEGGDKSDELVYDHDVVAKRLRGALPDTVSGVRRAAEVGAAATSLPDFVRSKEWLDEKGKCLDHVRPGLSDIPQAGRGAFANRFIPAGTVVLPLPLIHINRTLLDMYELRDDPQHVGRLLKSKLPRTKQILYNYCIGHPDSSVLLYPYGTMGSYVNHAREANVKLRWNEDEGNMNGYHHPDWLKEDSATVLEHKPGLMLELVATRDINEGDEVLLDYGSEWAKAWVNHVETWQSKVAERRGKGNEYIYPHVLNQDPIIRIQSEQEKDPYPSNVDVCCYHLHEFSTTSNPVEARIVIQDGKKSTEKGRAWKEGALYGANASYIRHCEVLERKEVMSNGKEIEYLYTVLLEADKDQPQNSYDRLIFDVPRKGIKFVDLPYQSDQHLEFAFRHEINVPDDVWPSAWMDLKKKDGGKRWPWQKK